MNDPVHAPHMLGRRDMLPTKWFGADWWGPPCNHGKHVDTPIGGVCCFCDERVEAEDFGLFVLTAKGPPDVPPPDEDYSEAPMHAECWIRALYGSVRHQRGECHGDGTCNARTGGLSVREDATLAAAYFMERLNAYKQARGKVVN